MNNEIIRKISKDKLHTNPKTKKAFAEIEKNTLKKLHEMINQKNKK